ncbi:transducin-like enhancer protein 4 [Trichonephila clavata]|uniref:Transducin-like enhancer protein 4 n=1 Tax=Trichonephila clavata TaxID=2740835 RepID=A0A8X6JKF2_TRICU|nr:transducin-like enhancer protein 4 [Trichonephila clavata]
MVLIMSIVASLMSSLGRGWSHDSDPDLNNCNVYRSSPEWVKRAEVKCCSLPDKSHSLMYSLFHGPPPQAGQPFKFTVAESCDRIKEEFSFLQAQYHNLKLECEKLASEKTEMQRHYVMYYEMSYGLNVEMHKQESSLAVSTVVYLLTASSTKKTDYNRKSPAIHLHKRGKETAGVGKGGENTRKEAETALVTLALALILSPIASAVSSYLVLTNSIHSPIAMFFLIIKYFRVKINVTRYYSAYHKPQLASVILALI